MLVSYVQFRDRSGRDANTSPALVGAMVNQAAAVAAPLDFGAIVDFRMLRTLVMLASGILVAVGWSCWQNREMVAVFLARMTHPSSTLRYPTKTQLEAVTREAVVQEGRTFTPSVLAGGVVPREALLTIRPVEGDAGRMAGRRSPTRWARCIAASPTRFASAMPCPTPLR
jgi:hypothetical protein